jgi:hypothetical protein
MLIKVTPKTKNELADEYQCSSRTIRTMCREAGIYSRKRLTPKEVRLFYDTYGPPEMEYRYE